MCSFTNAATAFRLCPTVANLIALTDNAVPLLQSPRRVTPARARWAKVTPACGFRDDFTRLRVTIDRRLSDSEVEQAAGCVGYALRQTLCGEPLLVTNVLRSHDAQQTILICEYDSRVSARTMPDVGLALKLAALYVQAGTPVRLTDRQGTGTQRTRLVSGVGVCEVEFAVR